mgnify:CR=1 FL=1
MKEENDSFRETNIEPQKRALRPRKKISADERRPSREERNKTRSEGERLIAQFLADEKIYFVHEYPMALKDEQNQVRIWYPDFFLPGLNIIIEYLGMKGKVEYEKAVRRKTKLFRELKVDFIYVTPKRFTRPDWKHYIISKIIEIMDSKGSEYHKMKVLSRKYKYKPTGVGDDWGLG